MGAWGITALESDAGLDVTDFIRKHLPEDGVVRLEDIINSIQADEWLKPFDVKDGLSSSSPQAVAELVMLYSDQEEAKLDFDGEWAKNDKKFGAITSFTAARETIQWMRDYLSDTLKYAVDNAAASTNDRLSFGNWGGWFEKEDWIGWQEHMSRLVTRLDGLLQSCQDNRIDLLSQQEPQNSLTIQNN